MFSNQYVSINSVQTKVYVSAAGEKLALLNTLYKDSESSCGRVMHLNKWLGSLPIKD